MVRGLHSWRSAVRRQIHGGVTDDLLYELMNLVVD